MTTFRLKRSDVPGKVPLTTDLKGGELALNTTDGKLFFTKTVGTSTSMVVLSQISAGLVAGTSTVATVSPVSTIKFNEDEGFTLTDLGSGEVKVGFSGGYGFRYWDIGGSVLSPTKDDTIHLVAGEGVTIASSTATNTVTIGSTTAGGANLIKTFNVLNSFDAPLTGTAIFVPSYTDYIRGIQLTNGEMCHGNLTAALYRNEELLGFYTIPANSFRARITGLNFRITPDDYLAVSMVSGSGLNFTLALLNS